jgi:hypothetical protein
MTHISNVEWRKVLENFRAAYQSMCPEEILITELLANSIDAGALHITISTRFDGSSLVLRVDDDGKGMRSKDEFERYHDLGSLTKTKGGTIGWAGIGAKLYLDKCVKVRTETRSSEFEAASVWTFAPGDKAPHWDDVTPQCLVSSKTGTSVEIEIASDVDRELFSPSTLKDWVLRNYNYALKPHGQIEIVVQGKVVAPFDPAAIAVSAHPFTFKLKTGEQVAGKFFILREAAPSGFELVSITVHGKTIGEQQHFNQLARIKEIYRVAGFVQCDSLIHIVTTSKDGFNRRSPLWLDFTKKVGERFARWLEKEGKLFPLQSDSNLEVLARELEKDLNKVFASPEIRELGLDPFQLISRRPTAIPDESGERTGIEIDGVQMTTGTVGGQEAGSGVPTEGDDPGKGVRTDSAGSLKISERPRRTRGGISIVYAKDPKRSERAWPDPWLRAIVINTSNPAFECADKLRALPYYTVDCCLVTITETIEAQKEREVAIRKLFECFLKGLN